MMNTEEKRFHAAVAAMHAMLTDDGWLGSITETAKQFGDHTEVHIARTSVGFADALITELDRTAAVKDSFTPQPAAAGWIAHNPGDPMPCSLDLKIDVKIANGIIRYNQAAGFWRGSSDLESNWGDCGEFSIVAWRPAGNFS